MCNITGNSVGYLPIARLQIIGFASPNANQFQAKCELLPLNNFPCVRLNYGYFVNHHSY